MPAQNPDLNPTEPYHWDELEHWLPIRSSYPAWPHKWEQIPTDNLQNFVESFLRRVWIL